MPRDLNVVPPADKQILADITKIANNQFGQ